MTMPLNHPTQRCQDKFTTKDVELGISIIILVVLKVWGSQKP